MRRILVLLTTMVAGVLLASGVALAVSEVEPNDSIAGAQAIEAASFDLTENANITNSTTVPHATVNGTGNDTLDYYSFTVSQAPTTGTTGTFDIDNTEGGTGAFGYDSYLRLLDSSGTVLAFSGDSRPVDPGSTVDYPQSGFTGDSFITHTFFSPGTWYIEVGACCPLVDPEVPDPVPNTATYDLHVSISLDDTTPPRVEEVSPEGTGVDPTASVTATFSEGVRGRTVTNRTFYLERVVGVNNRGEERLRKVRAQLFTVSSPQGGVITAELDPVNALPSGEYQATVTTGVTDLLRNPLDQDSGQEGNQEMVWRFTVGS